MALIMITRNTTNNGSISEIKLLSVASASSSRKSAKRSSIPWTMPVCSLAASSQIAKPGKTDCLPNAAERASPFSTSPAAARSAVSTDRFPTELALILSASPAGTRTLVSRAAVRANLARASLCAIGPRIGSLMRALSQNASPGLLLIKASHPRTSRVPSSHGA